MNPLFPDDDVMVASFDFDGVLAEPVWPDPGIGEPIPAGLDLMMQYFRRGYRIIVFTSRHWASHDELVEWLHRMVGSTVSQVVCGKPLASVYVDDRALRFPLDSQEEIRDIARRYR